jgi:hypothetical protein
MKFFFGNRDKLAQDVAIGTVNPSESGHADEKQATTFDDNSLERVPSPTVQAGVKKVEAVTLTWTKNQLIFAYGW